MGQKIWIDFTKEDIWMVDKHMKRCLILLDINDMHYTSLEWLKLTTTKKSDITKGWQQCVASTALQHCWWQCFRNELLSTSNPW